MKNKATTKAANGTANKAAPQVSTVEPADMAALYTGPKGAPMANNTIVLRKEDVRIDTSINLRFGLSLDETPEDEGVLAKSILEQGIKTPPRVVRDEDGGYSLVFGFRRFDAIPGPKTLVLFTVEPTPAATGDARKSALRLINLTENLARKPLNAAELPQALYQLAEVDKIPQVKIAKETGLSVQRVANLVNFRKRTIPAVWQDWIDSGKGKEDRTWSPLVSARTLEAISRLPADKQAAEYEKAKADVIAGRPPQRPGSGEPPTPDPFPNSLGPKEVAAILPNVGREPVKDADGTEHAADSAWCEGYKAGLLTAIGSFRLHNGKLVTPEEYKRLVDAEKAEKKAAEEAKKAEEKAAKEKKAAEEKAAKEAEKAEKAKKAAEEKAAKDAAEKAKKDAIAAKHAQADAVEKARKAATA